MIIQTTEAYCDICRCNHPATIEHTAQKILATVQCPKQSVQHEISPAAEIYMNLFNRYKRRETPAFKTSRCILNYIPITDACNFNCKVCGANAKHGKDANYLSMEEVKKRLKQVAHDGGVLSNFFGGEATLHPDIIELVRESAKLGLNTGIATNGYTLGKNRAFAFDLKQAGLKRVCLQFDSLESETLKKLGRDYLKEKLAAIQHCKEADIKFGLNVTVSKHNAAELPDIMDYALSQIPKIFNVSLLSLAPIGRHEAGEDISVFRDEMIEIILENWRKYGLLLEDIVHLPSFLPWGISIHPDCGAGIIMAKTRDAFVPLNHLIDLEKLFTLMGRYNSNSQSLRCKLALVRFALKSLRPGKRLAAIRLALGLLRKSPEYGILNFGLTNYKTLLFQDEQKIEQCTCNFYTANGPVKGCHHFTRPDDFPGSLNHQQKHGLL